MCTNTLIPILFCEKKDNFEKKNFAFVDFSYFFFKTFVDDLTLQIKKLNLIFKHMYGFMGF